MRFPPLTQKSSVMDIAPMVDLVFLLLVFFMIGSRFAQPSMEMQLPEASTGNISQSNSIVISVNRERNISLNGRFFTMEELSRGLKAAMQENSNSEVILRLDGRIPYEYFVRIMDRCREAGATNLRLEYEPTK
ncbi:MAG: biopolymer transporter ExbD [Leptospiraceae bacterium]|nr:biopolymer transporter ExbD [Leptospiraceae bacterium]